MTERFTAIEGEVWDRTTLPPRKLEIEDAEALVQTWASEAEKCRQAGRYDLLRCWQEPASVLRAAISRAETQRRLAGRFGTRSPA